MMLNYKAEWPLHVRWPFRALFLGWWLMGQFGLSGGQFHMKPSISVSPSVVVPVGENATIRCKSEGRYLPVAFILFKEESGSWQSVSTKEIEEGEAVFHIIHAKPSDAGTYWCSFGSEYFPWHRRYSSDKVHIKTKEVVYSKPFISLNPMGLVPLGAVVTVQCKNTEYRLAEYYLLKEGSPEPTQVKRSDGKEVVFSIANVTLSDGGIYWCEYRDSSSRSDRYSHASDRLYLNVTDPSLAKPLIQMEPKGPHVLGANVTIHCQGPEKGLTFLLYKSKDFIASQIAQPDSNTTTFSILTVRAEDAGNYTCQYHGKGNPFVWSKPTVPMKLVAKGWWLTGQFGLSEGRSYPRPSISVNPTTMVPLGGNVTIHCSCGIPSDVSWYLAKHESEFAINAQLKKEQSCEVVFSMSNAQLSDVGMYSCRYCVWNSCSDFSNKVSINITDPSLPQPSIQMNLRGKDASGLNVTITCQGPENGLMFALYNSREQIAFQAAEPKKNTAAFSVSLVRSEDARNYRCQYRQKGDAFVWSEPSDPTELELEVEDSLSMEPYLSLGAAGLVLLFLVLIVAEAIYNWRSERPK
uniref:immunoglobulin superfamily member 1-like isoform X2 n=1 Tax=Pogona vitticeps TaxID=103695 RepID=UPI003BB87567